MAEQYAFATTDEIAELYLRILADPRQPKPDMVYLYGQMPAQIGSVLKKGAEIYLYRWPQTQIAVGQSAAVCGNEGSDVWVERLLQLEVPLEHIMVIPNPTWETLVHTHLEAIQLIKHAKENGWRTIYVVAAALHQLRAFMETVSQIIWQCPEICAVSVPADPLSWTENIMFSQENVYGRRCDLIADHPKSELAKIEAYYQKGDLVSGSEVLDYLNRRDNSH